MNPSAALVFTLPSLQDATLVSLGFTPQQARVVEAGIVALNIGQNFIEAVSPSLSLPIPENVLALTATIDALAASGWFDLANAQLRYADSLLASAGYPVQ